MGMLHSLPGKKKGSLSFTGAAVVAAATAAATHAPSSTSGRKKATFPWALCCNYYHRTLHDNPGRKAFFCRQRRGLLYANLLYSKSLFSIPQHFKAFHTNFIIWQTMVTNCPSNHPKETRRAVKHKSEENAWWVHGLVVVLKTIVWRIISIMTNLFHVEIDNAFARDLWMKCKDLFQSGFWPHWIWNRSCLGWWT